MNLGRVVVTRGLMAHCEEHGIDLIPFVHQYASNDWGDLGAEDQHSNNMEMFSLAGHVLGKYKLPTGQSIYIETNWNEQERYTTVMFPDER
ncbi:hypothetical protein [Burkholderia pseudomallei]|uniref:hypothetical protein n=1 Tax=Burkholderia pseudomallei TaxID=28450 RepID=UPI0012B17C93|nr:hypothetical protein [Burkholderia pseudomallei]